MVLTGSISALPDTFCSSSYAEGAVWLLYAPLASKTTCYDADPTTHISALIRRVSVHLNE